MAAFVQIIIFLASVAIVWFFAGILIDSVSRLSSRFCRTGFFTAFFLLGALTSISEISVALNSTISGVPAASAGNLVGASFVVMLLIVPLLAIGAKGIPLNNAVSARGLFLILAVIALPVLLVVDGTVTTSEGLLALLAYGTMAYALYRKRQVINACDPEPLTFTNAKPVLTDISRIVVSALAIFAAAHFLVDEAVFFANALHIPISVIGLVVLSLGTNVPEITIAIRSLWRGRSDIAFGDYLGSSAMNTLVFAGLALVNGTFYVEATGFIFTSVLMIGGLGFLYMFAHTRSVISRAEGALLLLFYACFLLVEFLNIALLSGASS